LITHVTSLYNHRKFILIHRRLSLYPILYPPPPPFIRICSIISRSAIVFPDLLGFRLLVFNLFFGSSDCFFFALPSPWETMEAAAKILVLHERSAVL